MFEIDKEITEIVNKYYEYDDDTVSPFRYEIDGSEHELSKEIVDYLDSQRKLGNIKEYSVEDVEAYNNCSNTSGICSVACVGNNNELYHRVIDWHIF